MGPGDDRNEVIRTPVSQQSGRINSFNRCAQRAARRRRSVVPCSLPMLLFLGDAMVAPTRGPLGTAVKRGLRPAYA